MRRIAIILILFQLIGCIQQPAITTNQNAKEINELKTAIETIKKGREHDKQQIERYESEIFCNRV
ncbi:MAG: hypothetical protein LBR09_01445 [Endomicrobium sp.]|jgi:hypothetical protein|nr:hypothetical protein [Endomicrobium sp.]